MDEGSMQLSIIPPEPKFATLPIYLGCERVLVLSLFSMYHIFFL